MRFFAPRLISVVFLLCFGSASNGRAQDEWVFRSPTPTGNRIASYAYGNGRFVGVGEYGEVVTSSDGKAWSRSSVLGESDAVRVIFAEGQFVAIDGPTIYRSSDGRTWTHQTAPARLEDVVYGNGIFVALTVPSSYPGNHRFATSTDGVTWTLRENTIDPTRVLFANGVFVAPAPNGQLLRSTDGINWSAITVTTSAVSPAPPPGIAGNGRFVVSYFSNSQPSAYTYSSSDGVTWREVSTFRDYATQKVRVPNPGTYGFANGYFYLKQAYYAGDQNSLYRSTDGENWTPVSAYTPLDVTTFTGGAGIIVASQAVRTGSSSYANTSGHFIHTSADAITWDTHTSALPVTAPPTDVVYGLGRFFYAGNISHDGRTWAPGVFQPTFAAGNRVYRLTSTNYMAKVESSSDGLTSQIVDVKIPQPAAVAFGGGHYVMVGTGSEIASSEDGDTWTSRTNPTANRLNAVIYAFGRFIAGGENGTLLTSTDGATWTLVGSSALAGFHVQQLGASSSRLVINARSIAPGNTAGTVTLGDGIDVVVTSDIFLGSLVFFNGSFVGTSVRTAATNYYAPQLWKSIDGKVWSEIRFPTRRSFYQSNDAGPVLATGNGTLLLSYMAGPNTSSPYGYNALLQATDLVAAGAASITHAPAPLSRAKGETAVFSVGVTGDAPLAYQWRRNGELLPGATAPVLSIPSITEADAASYSATITNPQGSVTSDAAPLAVTPPVPLTITQQPTGGELADYVELTLSVGVTGSGPITYQWRRNGQPIYGANGSTYLLRQSSTFSFLVVGSYDVVVSAPYSQVTSQAVPVTWGGLQATISGGSGIVPRGGSITMTVVATGAHPPFTYQWGEQSGPDIPGATSPTLTLSNLNAPGSRSYAVTVTNNAGFHTYASFQVSVADGPGDIKITSQPTSQSASPGGTVTLSAASTESAAYSFQWRRNGTPIPGATGPQLTLTNVTGDDSGEYQVVVYSYDRKSAVISDVATVNVSSSRIINLSARAVAGTGEDALILGFVVKDSQTNNLLLRSVGPGLVAFNLKGAMANPKIRIVNSNGAAVAENDDWNESIATTTSEPATSAAMSAVGAFSLAQGSRDSAIIVRGPNDGAYTALVSSDTNATGIVLNEIYAASEERQRLQNLSARARVGSGDSVLIGGFVITGTRPMNLLIRAIGPSLAGKGIAVPLTNPKLTLYNANGIEVGNNDNWGASPQVAEIRSVTNTIGAFALNEGSNDAAMLVSLAPGTYSAQASSADGSSGVALLEIYVTP